MTRNKLPSPAFYPLDELAREWKCSVALLRVFSTFGTGDGSERLEITEHNLGEVMLLGVSREEKERFEQLSERKASASRLNAGERDSLLALVGALSVLWCGADPEHEEHPYRLLADIERAAAAHGIPMLRGDDTNTRLIREGLALLRANGYISPRRRAPLDALAVETALAREPTPIRISDASRNLRTGDESQRAPSEEILPLART